MLNYFRYQDSKTEDDLKIEHMDLENEEKFSETKIEDVSFNAYLKILLGKLLMVKYNRDDFGGSRESSCIINTVDHY